MALNDDGTGRREDRCPRQQVRPAVTILEIEAEGHRLDYLCHLWSAADPDRSTVVTSRRAIASEEYRDRPVLSAAHVRLLDDDVTRGRALEMALTTAVESSTSLVVPDADLYLPAVLRYLWRRPRTRVRITLLLMRAVSPFGGRAATRPLPAIVKIAIVQLIRLLPQVRVRFLSDAFGVVRSRPGYPGVRPVPDPVVLRPDRATMPPTWFPAADSAVVRVGVFGLIGARKNVPLLLSAVAAVPEAVLILGGRVDPDVSAVLDGPIAERLLADKRLVVRDSMLPGDEFDAALASVDMTAVLHDNDSPSGILAESCVRGVPCLVPTGGWLDQVVTETGIGRAVDLTTEGVADGIRHVGADRDGWRSAVRSQSGRIGVVGFVDGLLA